jgi:hypothetical protein
LHITARWRVTVSNEGGVRPDLLLDTVGAGAMGIVMAGYDPTL